jgi:hypothetical protein
MRYLWLLLALWTAGAFTVAVNAQISTRDQDQIIGLEQQLTDAANRGDVTAVDQFLASEYEVTSVTGTQTGRDQALQSVREHQQHNTISNVRVRVLGNAAVATYDSTVSTTDPHTGSQTTEKVVENDFWIKRGGHWVLLASQGSPAQPLPAEMWTGAQSQ